MAVLGLVPNTLKLFYRKISEDITRKLQHEHEHFPQRAAQVSPTDPDCDTPMVVTLEQLRPYEHNPRFIHGVEAAGKGRDTKRAGR